MIILSSLAELRLWRSSQTATVALVPTMGNLHAGHLQLVTQAQQQAELVVVSIFVNPLQFGANEDLDSYPRTFKADCEALAAAGATAVFAPTVEDMYPRGASVQTFVEVPGISEQLCGASRPGHFRGVATIVCKLFNMVQPQVAVFGEKDFQQLQVIRLMTADLSLPIEVLGAPTARAPDGLALSSRNGYLSVAERQQAPAIYRIMNELKEGLLAGDSTAEVEQLGTTLLTDAGFVVDYVAVRRTNDLQLATATDKDLVVLVAAKLGTTRLIDNLPLTRH